MREEGDRLSAAWAAALTLFVLVVAFAVLIVALFVAHAIAGSVGASIAFFVWELALLVFLTLRAYPPGVKTPWIRLLAATVFFSVLIPAIYLTWRWCRQETPQTLG